MSESENPNPHRITAESWWFMEQLLALEPNTASSGVYANKPGYHGTRAENQARDAQDGDVNYSVEKPLDLEGPSDKAAAYDWTHWAAQSGDYRSMAKYGDRLEAAFNARDPRLYGWREAQGQTDTDSTPESMDFDSWTRGTPSSSHAWHWHLSEHRKFVTSRANKECMLSVLSGETLQAYLARGGVLVKDGVAVEEKDVIDIWQHFLAPNGYNMQDHLLNGETNAAKANEGVQQLLARPPVAPAPVDPAALKAAMMDPEVLAAFAKAVNDDLHSRTAG